ncbi:hypothetical protein LTR99_004951 [Exophiala xenobiotica]|uniref:Major facilitator superfamily (MFS) profile domain-containing protein n=1 Tax=Vermiconidia calcicola TaxID=1690605 RepID=A0AAV9PUX9_9PEZI|nr:hypothetical protein LTR96_003786 [Exophiala xenobiotica]KAK5528296.1 hypothetical protein LTR25_010603 [Vermiconidia calcicola]KAK5534186.1 hypothetical protein LTR23_008979 [Chaetothyriales sp. CCFEE 6169]KAK5303190.1 hypothetical protein LTR99_004951 [Exophiala xenobiotica]KAK5333397.1 hypothetical protein LTR98_010602 [Exophiala xenobiotica]
MAGIVSVVKPMHRVEREVAVAEAPALHRVIWYKDPGLRKLYGMAFALFFASATTGYDGSMLNGLQILDVWQDYFHHPTGSILGLFGSIYSIGSLAGLPFAPYLSDTFGRRIAIMVGCLFLFAGVAIQSASQNFSMFIAGRFFVGFGNSMCSNSAPLLLTELAHPQHRGRVTTVYNQLWDIGSIAATWITFGTFTIKNNWSWRIPSIFQAFPTLILFCTIWTIPESPRWLISKDRHSEALATLAKYHANGDATDLTVQFEFREIRETLHLEFQSKRSSSYLDFLKTKGSRYRLLLVVALGLFSQWSGNGLTSYYFSLVMKSIGVTNKNEQFEINGCKTIVSLVVGLSAAAVVDKVGRRPLFLSATCGMFVSFVLWMACSALYDLDGNLAAGKTVIFFIFLHGAFYNIAWSGLLVGYTVEIMPYKIRAKGLMLMNFFVQAALVFNQYINPIGLDHLQPRWRFYAIYCGWLMFELLFVALLFVETRGVTLEEVAKIFDGEDAEVAHVDLDVVQEKVQTMATEVEDARPEHKV